eukprot:gnl/MRDRNA2_/MRDRNA2_90102_c0_seq1.p1 gnl/MRDRNA2_/MRDRNA2_90102_c0~~gnl/MRDRNA2_/MRDRNA2_90102_c0_seq1.p1  ORF type:complete len:1361 (-),score=354.98 gnl/MRDRNA2_/MRDRNA2_90102_c0_seq1:181-4263(-)
MAPPPEPAFVKDLEAKAEHGDAISKKAAICLEATRQVILKAGCGATAVSYFGATVSVLTRLLEAGSEDDEAVGAQLLILRMALLATPAASVSSRSAEVSAVLTAAVNKMKERVDIVKQALSCFVAAVGATYRSQGRPNRKVMKTIFQFISDERTQVSHKAQWAVAAVLQDASEAKDEQTLEFVSHHVIQLVDSANPAQKDVDKVSAAHAISLLKRTMGFFSIDQQHRICISLVGLPAKLGQHPVSTLALQYFKTHFASDIWKTTEHKENMCAIIDRLLRVPLSMLNIQYVVAYMEALSAAVCALLRQPPMAPQATASVEKLFTLFGEKDPSIRKALVAQSLQILHVATEMEQARCVLEHFPRLCKPLLKVQCKAAWPHVFQTIAGLFTSFSTIRKEIALEEISTWTAAAFHSIRELLSELVAIRDNAHGGELQNVFGEQLDACFISAIEAFGAENVLSVAPLRLLEHSFNEKRYEQLSRSWLLLLLKGHCACSNLKFFTTFFMPLASKLKQTAAQAQADPSAQVHAKKYTLLMEQVWNLLPGFCHEPLDLHEALLSEQGKIAKQFVAVMVNESSLRYTMAEAFSKMCRSATSPSCLLAQRLQEKNKGCLVTLSGRVIPEMFTTYLKIHAECGGLDLPGRTASRAKVQPNLNRKLLLEAVQDFAKVSDAQLLRNLFKTVVQRMLKSSMGEAPDNKDTATPQDMVALADIAIVLIPQLPPDQLELVVKVFTPMLSGVTGTSLVGEEKKRITALSQRAAYRAVRAIAEHSAAMQPQFFGDPVKLLKFWSILKDARQCCEMHALKARIAGIRALLNHTEGSILPHINQFDIKHGFREFLASVVPEVLFYLRDHSTATRDMARDCLQVIVQVSVASSFQTELVNLLSAGLAGMSVDMRSCAVDAFSRLFFELGSRLGGALRDDLVEMVLLLLEDSSAQVYRSALKFVKVVVYVLPSDVFPKYLKNIMALFSSPHMVSAKMLVRRIVEKLIRSLELDTLKNAFPKQHLPLLMYVHKEMDKRQRKRYLPRDEEEEEEEDESGDVKMGKGSDQKQKKTWEEFNDEDDDGPGGDDKNMTWDARQLEKKKKDKAGEGDASMKDAESQAFNPAMHPSVQAMLDAWEDETDSEDEEDPKSKNRKGKRKRNEDEGESATWIKEDGDVPLDFMSADAAHAVLTLRPNRKKARNVDTGTFQSKADALRFGKGLKVAEDGRLIVEEEPDESDAGKKAGFTLGADTGKKTQKSLSHLSQLRNKKRENRLAARREKAGHQVKGLSTYSPGSKGEGDKDTRKEKLEPYAYIRLNPKVGKERHKHKAVGSFKKVIKGAKQGIAKGMKSLGRQRKIKQAEKTKVAKKERRNDRLKKMTKRR